MGPDALQRYLAGEKLPAAQMRTPLVELPLGATGEAGGKPAYFCSGLRCSVAAV